MTTTAPIIAMDEIESSQLHAIGYDSASQTLAIRFKDRRTGAPTSLYHYSNFSAEDFEAFKNAESIGSHFGKHIKPFAKKYPYTQIEKTPAA
ncbi:hypothetical protein KMC49_gp50 [Ralstonia phage Firinga]|uniref:KTSC domain-containing protein n=2 Tax=Firingavirus firinga TaxID=2846043 RepID=A0A7G5B9Z5_9CAUD|nr:hypothetical protein KMC49_gp50 [Ralstonia phage Firinga]QMV33118.1 hypothetical protein 18C_00050 [Ralstonia phage Firinga]QMV33339.1 hypothetical protein 12C_00029 [Ralstonia phage Hennie]